MSNERPSSSRFAACNGAAVRALRHSRGWTQDELADASGYSKRLIQKAESGGALAPGTLEVLAQTLSTADAPVSVAALIATPLSVVEEFIAIQNEHTAETGPAAAHLIADDFTMWCAGNRNDLPVAGDWQGVGGLTQFFRKLFEMITPSPDGILQQVHYLSNGPVVVVWAQAVARVEGMPGEMPVVWINHRYEVHDGKITRWENLVDTQTIVEHLAEARARELLQGGGAR